MKVRQQESYYILGYLLNLSELFCNFHFFKNSSEFFPWKILCIDWNHIFRLKFCKKFPQKNHCLKVFHNSLVPNLLNLHITINTKPQLKLHTYLSCACVYFSQGNLGLFFSYWVFRKTSRWQNINIASFDYLHLHYCSFNFVWGNYTYCWTHLYQGTLK
jgi:hypothetical protein